MNVHLIIFAKLNHVVRHARQRKIQSKLLHNVTNSKMEPIVLLYRYGAVSYNVWVLLTPCELWCQDVKKDIKGWQLDAFSP